jgi:type VI secretion system secreted protein Hcp
MRRSGFKGLVAAGLVATGIAASTSIVSASDMFLKVGNITGESTDAKHPGEMDVLSWSWGTSNGTAQTKKGQLPSACIQDLALVKLVDTASPALIMMSVTGEVVTDATLTVRRSSQDSPSNILVLKLKNVSVPSYQTGGSEAANSLTEHLTLHFDSLLGEYRPIGPDGKAGQAVTFNVSGACP